VGAASRVGATGGFRHAPQVSTRLIGCSGLDDNPVVYVKNGTAIPVEVVLLHDGGSESLVDDELPPGGAVTYSRMAECLHGVLIARDSDGQEVARSAPTSLPRLRVGDHVESGALVAPSGPAA
jgi:hypothetical protein